MIDNDTIQVQKGESRQAFLRYLPKRIAAFEQRMQRYRREGWDHAGMAVLRGDLLRLGDAGSQHEMLETCRHLLILARMVGEHVANKTEPDLQEARKMFAELSKVSESLPAAGEHLDYLETSETTPETDKHPLSPVWERKATRKPPVAEAITPAAAAALATVDAIASLTQAEPIAPVLAEPAAHVEPIDAAAHTEPSEPIVGQLAEPSADAEPIDAAAHTEPNEPIVRQVAEPSADAAVETAAPIEQSVPIHVLDPEELAEPIASVDPVDPAISPPPVEAAEQPLPMELSGQAEIATSVEPFEAVEPVDLFEPDEPDMASEAGVRRVFHLNDGNAFAIELGQRLESEGYAVEPVESIDELSELLMCLLPQMLLVDASHMSDLDAIDRMRRDTLQRSQTQRRIQMVALAAQDSLEARRVAHRAGVDALLFPPFDIADVVGRLLDLDTATEEQQVRVLIVDDERADALFAQTVLTRAGMQAHVENDPMYVLETIKALHPDLVLMDLHMPFANGVEVTMLIREDPVFARLPIVFLSGESDPDSRLEAINAGGDDFLFKPIRPRHLIAAVRERMRRMHPKEPSAGAPDDPTDMQRRA